MRTCYYRLNPDLALRGYPGQPFMLIRYGESWSAPISERFLGFLQRCDGIEPFYPELMFQDEAETVERCLAAGIICASEEPCPILPRQQYRVFNHPRKYIAQWSITGRCNLRCNHCFVMSANADKEIREYSTEEASRIVSQLADYGVETVMLTGGEPLLHPDFMQIARMILNAGMTLNWINTNGMLLTEEILDQLERLGVKPKMAISFDGFGTHDWMRNCPGAEKKALNAIRMCGERKLPLRACVNVNRRTLPGLVHTVRELVRIGITQVFLLRTTEAPRWADTLANEPELGLSPEEFIALIPELTRALMPEVRDGLKVKFFGIVNIDRYTTAEKLLSGFNKAPGDCSAWCPKTHNGVFISSDGYIVPCDGMEGGARDAGLLCDEINILHRSLDQIYHSHEYSRFGVTLTAEDIRRAAPKCVNCEYWDSCYGGKCRVSAFIDGYRENGRYCSGDASRCDAGACIFIRKGYRDQLAQVLREYADPC